jgi:hypothetical protein
MYDYEGQNLYFLDDDHQNIEFFVYIVYYRCIFTTKYEKYCIVFIKTNVCMFTIKAY